MFCSDNVTCDLIKKKTFFYSHYPRSEDVREPPAEDAPQNIVLNVLPMFHMYALEGVLIAGLVAGATIVSLPRFDPHTFLSAIEKYKVLTRKQMLFTGS